MPDNTPDELMRRMAGMEQRLEQLELDLATAARRRRRASTARIALYVLAGLAYVYYFRSMPSFT